MSSATPSGFSGQGDGIADYVFPIFNCDMGADGLRWTEFLGTGFFIGAHGYALTAKHVMRRAALPAIAMRGSDRTWRAFAIKESDDHPTEDVSVIQIEPLVEGLWRSIFTLPSNKAVGSGMGYFLFGYPESVLHELVENNHVQMRPDLIYSEGHIRRRMSDIPLPSITGTRFLELSQVAGPGCSGSPVINTASLGLPFWKLVGVYVGERLDAYSTSVGYAVRLEDLRDWQPDILSRSLAAEANDTGEPSQPI